MPRGYCRCGQEIHVDYRWNGLCEVILFVADGQEIDECPQCGECVGAWIEVMPNGECLRLKKGALLNDPKGGE